MKHCIFIKKALIIGLIGFVISSCNDDKNLYDDEIGSVNDPQAILPIKVRKDFEIKESMLEVINPNGNLKNGGGGTGLTFPTVNNIGVGYNALTDNPSQSIFKAGVDITPYISTVGNDKGNTYYCCSEHYSEIDNNVSTTLSASLGVTTPFVKANGSLSIKTQSRVTESESSIYISKIVYRTVGYGTLQINNNPALNNVLVFPTNLYSTVNSSGERTTKDGITLSSQNFRTQYGDKFASKIHFGVTVVATVQISNYSLATSSRKEVEASATASVSSFLSGSSSWSSVVEKNSSLKDSKAIITVTSSPGPSIVAENVEQVNQVINETFAAFNAGNYQAIATEYLEFSNLYPTYPFIYVRNETYKNHTSLLFNDISFRLVGFENLTSFATNNCLGKAFACNFDPNLLQPVYGVFNTNVYSNSPTADISQCFLAGYVFKNKSFSDLIPLYYGKRSVSWGWNGASVPLVYYSGFSTSNTGFATTPALLGWIYPNQ